MEGRKSGGRGRNKGVDGGNLACETVGIRNQETASHTGQSASVGAHKCAVKCIFSLTGQIELFSK